MQLREHYGERAAPHDNGHRTRPVVPVRRGLRRRSLMLVASAIVFFAVLGARACKSHPPLTEAQRRQARIDIYLGCFYNDCTPEQLRQQLEQLDAMPSAKERDQ